MNPPKEVEQLVERFDRNKDQYTSGNYNEAQLRQEFVNPFFMALGWDIDNKQGFAEPYKEVIHEDAIKIGGATKAPDYCFRIGGTRKFFVEAKNPSVNLKDDLSPAYQLRRYAWSAKLPLSILTDFEEFAVYDCRLKPLKTDKSSNARIHYLTYTDYIPQWELIASVFSKEAVLKGSFDKHAETARGKKGTAEVDDAFLKEIESWRELLAKNIAVRNGKLSQPQLNFAVQRTIDRIIFLRICEDRGIELYGKLLGLVNGARVYQRLTEQFYRADEKYNSGLFHFEQEKGRPEGADELTPKLHIDDKPLIEIISKLYYPDCPYEFSVLPADILGQVYEQFLGKVIRLTAGHQAKVEDKPEVKKAGGVYYTPTYIVDYIVKNTVGKLLGPPPILPLENKGEVSGDVGVAKQAIIKPLTPKEASKLRVLDPACGSGSFLIGAYQYLLDWHLDWYLKNDPTKYTSGKDAPLFKGPGGDWRLTTSERKRILLNNIYGVDIDSQAVEVTKLSLLLKVLEGENEQTISQQLKMFHERALPDLGNNIKCGNSLIGPDFYDDKQLSLLDEEEKNRINVFDWKTEFKEIMDCGGFDVVIGNPPYIPIESISDAEKQYYQSHHSELQRKYDSSVIFILSLLNRLKTSGLLAYISSVTWQTGENYALLRASLFGKLRVSQLVNLPFDVFENAYVDTGIYILSGRPVHTYKLFRFPKKVEVGNLDNLDYVTIPSKLVSSPDYKIILDPRAASIFSRLAQDSQFVQLGEITISTQGLAGNMFETSKNPRGKNSYPFLEKGQVHRYSMDISKKSFTDMSGKPSLVRFYGAEPKLLIRRVISRQDRILATIIEEKMVFKKDINPFILKATKLALQFVLGILNSSLISYLYLNTSSIATKDDFRQTTLAELRRIPVRNISVSSPADKSIHDRMVELVDQMLALHKQLPTAKTEQEKTVIQRQIDSTDKQIDQLVYELYDLTEEEIDIVGGKTDVVS